MRIILLGSLKNSPSTVQLVQTSLQNLHFSLEDDLVFYHQTSLDSPAGVEYDRHTNYIEIILSKTHPPTPHVLRTTVQEALKKQLHSRPSPPFSA